MTDTTSAPAAQKRPHCYESTVELARPESLSGGTWVLSRLTALTIILGKNGSGKSLLLRAWRDTDKDACHYVVPERTGDLQYQINYMADQLDPRKPLYPHTGLRQQTCRWYRTIEQRRGPTNNDSFGYSHNSVDVGGQGNTQAYRPDR